ncbi:MAG: hypothetical protein IVW54_15320 [Candidatus Binataceae bacterium]|nr:hypothetical protein [Candidatus Binataceae bacterium]
MIQWLLQLQYAATDLVGYLKVLPDVQRAGGSFVAGLIMVYLTIKDREWEQLSIFLGLGAMLCLAYALSVAFDFYR